MINWKNIPFIRLVIPLIAGILLAIYLEWNNWFFSLTLLFLLVFLFVFNSRRIIGIHLQTNYIFGGLLNISMVLVGINLVSLKTALNFETHYINVCSDCSHYEITVKEVPKVKPNSIQVIAQVNAIGDTNQFDPCNGSVLLYFKKDSLAMQLLQGDQILLQSNLQIIKTRRNPGGFNYKQYLEFNEIYQQGFVDAGNWKKVKNSGWNITRFASELRNDLLGLLKKNGVKGEQLAVASALILGYKDDLSEDLKHSYSSAGAMHVLAVSGLHVGIIFFVLTTALKFMDTSKKMRFTKVVISILALWFYALLTGLSPSVMRAATMFSFVAFGAVFDRKGSIYNTLAASAFVLLCINPYLVMEVGFQLSFLAVLGIVYFQPLIYKRLYFSNPILDWIWSISAVSIAAQLTTFPLGLLYFHQFPTYFMVSNLVVIPGAFLVIAIGLLVFLTSPFAPLSELVGKLLDWVIYGINSLVRLIDTLPMPLIEGISISILESWLIYITLVIMVIGFQLRRLKYINISLFVVATLFIIDIREDRKIATTREIVIYDIKDELAIDFISGTSHYFQASKALLGDRSQLLFHVRHHWFDLDAKHPIELEKDADYRYKDFEKKGEFYLFNSKRLFVVTNDWNGNYKGAPIKLDILYVDDSFEGSVDQVLLAFNPTSIVMGRGVGYAICEQFQEQVEELTIAYHAIKLNGAFQLVF